MAARQGRIDPLGALARLDRTKVFLGTLALALIGLFLPGWYGVAVLSLVVVALALVQARTWPVTPPRARLIRMATLVALLGLAVTKLL